MVRPVVILCIVIVCIDAALALLLAGRRDHPAWRALAGRRYAHRGYHDKPAVPENSMAAFRRAVERGWGAELDVHLLKDGTLAVFHDSDLKRCAGVEGKIEDLTLPELRALRLEGTDEPVPLFDEVLALFEGREPLIIELKEAGGNHFELAKAVCERLDSYRGDYCIESFNPLVLRDVRRLRPAVCRGQLSKDFLKEAEGLGFFTRLALTCLFFNCITRPDFIAYRFEDRGNLFLRRCVRRYGLHEASWTIGTRRDMERAEADGAIPIFERFDPEQE